MGDHLRLRLCAAFVVAGAAVAAAATVLAPLPAAIGLILAAALGGALLYWPGALLALPLLLFADGAEAKVAVAAAGALPVAALYAWRRWSDRGERIRAGAAADERARLAREMHDSLSKTLETIALGAAALPDSLDEPDRASRPAATLRDGGREAARDADGGREAATLRDGGRETARDADSGREAARDADGSREAATLRDGGREAARDARGLIEELRTSPADAPLSDLVAAISQEWSARTGIGVILHSAGLDDAGDADPAPQAGIELCWILREALRNVAAHARAETVAVTLGRDGDGITLEVRDDGAGFAVPDGLAHLQRDGHHGIVGMHERARLCGGQLSVWSRPGGGTRVTATVPAAVVAGTRRPSGRVRLIVAAAASLVPLAAVLILATPDERTMPLAAQETGLPFDPRATHGPATAGVPAAPGRSPSAGGASPTASRGPSARPPAGSSAPAAPATVGTTAAQTRTCQVVYVKRSEWNNGFVADVTLTNTGSAPMRAWSMTFSYTAGQKLLSYWNAVASQNGAVLTVGPTRDQPVLDAGKSLTFGLQGTWAGSNPNPTAFAVNGSPCG